MYKGILILLVIAVFVFLVVRSLRSGSRRPQHGRGRTSDHVVRGAGRSNGLTAGQWVAISSLTAQGHHHHHQPDGTDYQAGDNDRGQYGGGEIPGTDVNWGGNAEGGLFGDGGGPLGGNVRGDETGPGGYGF